MVGVFGVLLVLGGSPWTQEPAEQPVEQPAQGPSEEPVEEHEYLVVEGGTVLTMVGEPLDGGKVLIVDGKVKAVGMDVEVPEGAKTIDASGKTVLPGLIDGLSRLYLSDQELSEGTSVGPELRVVDGIDLYAEDTDEILAHGVTAVHVVPGNRSLIGGLSAVVRVASDPGSVGSVAEEVAVRGQIGVPAGDSTSSLERLGSYTSVREALLGAQDYLFARERHERALAKYEREKEELKEKKGGAARGQGNEIPERPKKPSTEYGNEVLVRVLRREIPLHIEAHCVIDILNALRLKDEFEIDLVLLGCSEGYKVPGEISQRGVPVIVAPVSTSFSGASEIRYGDHSRRNAAELESAGVKVALGVGGSEPLHSKFVRTSAAIAAASGLGRQSALEAVTVRLAEILGIGDRIGSIAEGRDADLTVIDGDPLDVRAKVEMVLQNGEVVFERGAEG